MTYLSRADHFANYEEDTKAPASAELGEPYISEYHLNSNFDKTTSGDASAEHHWRASSGSRQGSQGTEEVILKQLEEKEPLPDKEKDQMAWVRAANQHRAIAEEIILKELIYV